MTAEGTAPRAWSVGGGLVLAGPTVLLVQNRRRDGRLDWSPPGGVIDPGESLIDGLTREVREETGLSVSGWEGPAYEIEAHAPDMGWTLRVEAHRALGYEGELAIGDPDGIVVAASFVTAADCDRHLRAAPRWVREPLVEWLAAPHGPPRTYRYRVEGHLGAGALTVHRVD